MWLNILAFPFNLVSEMIVGTHREQPGPVITTDAQFREAQKVQNEKRAAKNNLGSRRKGSGNAQGLGDTRRLSRDGAGHPLPGEQPQGCLCRFIIILYHFLGVMGAQGDTQLRGKMQQLLGMMPKEGERRAKRLGWAFLVLLLCNPDNPPTDN